MVKRWMSVTGSPKASNNLTRSSTSMMLSTLDGAGAMMVLVRLDGAGAEMVLAWLDVALAMLVLDLLVCQPSPQALTPCPLVSQARGPALQRGEPSPPRRRGECHHQPGLCHLMT